MAYANELGLEQSWASYLYDHGESPRARLAAADEAFAGCVAATRAAGYCYETASWVHETLAEYELDAGGDPGPELERAEALIARDGDAYIEPRRSAANLGYLRLKAGARDGRDLAPLQAASARSLAACFALAAHDGDCTLYAAEGALVAGGRPALAHAHELAVAAVALDPRGAEALRVLAETDLRLGRLDDGLAACARGLAVNANQPAPLAVQGELLVARARGQAPAGRRADARAGREALARAFALNPTLPRVHRHAADEAERLMAEPRE